MFNKFVFVTFLASVNLLSAQYDISFYCDVMANAYEGKNRVAAGADFKKMFMEELKKEGSFSNKFEDLKWVSFKSDEANTFRIITWQVKNEMNIHQSYGFIQTIKGALFELKDNVAGFDKGFEYEAMDANNWYGCLYYNIREMNTDKGKAYVLFGYDGLDDKNRVKVVDVLTFDKGKPVFGTELFKISEGSRPDLKFRILLDYSSLANVNCNYNEGMEMIVHDFVISRLGITEDGSPAKIPDGTYVGYKWDGKHWKYIEQLAQQVSNPEDIFYQPKAKESLKRDVFGRKKN
jgi:hypothetical protein